jgi:hypothetical protein
MSNKLKFSFMSYPICIAKEADGLAGSTSADVAVGWKGIEGAVRVGGGGQANVVLGKQYMSRNTSDPIATTGLNRVANHDTLVYDPDSIASARPDDVAAGGATS